MIIFKLFYEFRGEMYEMFFLVYEMIQQDSWLKVIGDRLWVKGYR